MYCPECGNDAGDAKFCPECGTDLTAVRETLRGRTTGRAGESVRRGRPDPDAAASGAIAGRAEQKAAPGGRLSPAVIWGGFGALAIVVLVVVVMMSGGFGSGSTETGAGASPPATAVSADTSGTYAELVDRANRLYDLGNEQFGAQDYEQGGAYFLAASKVYAAAWKKQRSDPSVGTDYAVALFYSGDIPQAIAQIGAVLDKNPGFQKGWLNKGIFLSHAARLAEQSGDEQKAAGLYDKARAAFTKAVAIDPASEAGKQADASLGELPK